MRLSMGLRSTSALYVGSESAPNGVSGLIRPSRDTAICSAESDALLVFIVANASRTRALSAFAVVSMKPVNASVR